MDARLSAVDVCVVGGGIVGLALARLLRQQAPALRVLVADSGDNNADDGKSVVVPAQAAQTLAQLNALPANSVAIVCARIRFVGGGEEVANNNAALGYGIDHLRARRALLAGANVVRARVAGMDADGARLADGRRIAAGLFVFACAAALPPPFARRQHSFCQRVVSLTASAPQWRAGFACQHYTARGIAVCAPRTDGRVGAVLCAPPAVAAEFCAMSNAALSSWLSDEFKSPLVVDGRRAVYAPQQAQTRPLAAANIAVVGQGASALHPVGAQGLALGLQDAQTLAAQCASAPSLAAAAAEYARKRRAAHARAAATTAALALAAHLRGGAWRQLGGAAAKFAAQTPAKRLVLALAGGGGAALQ